MVRSNHSQQPESTAKQENAGRMLDPGGRLTFSTVFRDPSDRSFDFGGTNGICTHPAAFTEPNANYYTMVPI